MRNFKQRHLTASGVREVSSMEVNGCLTVSQKRLQLATYAFQYQVIGLKIMCLLRALIVLGSFADGVMDGHC